MEPIRRTGVLWPGGQVLLTSFKIIRFSEIFQALAAGKDGGFKSHRKIIELTPHSKGATMPQMYKVKLLEEAILLAEKNLRSF